MPETITKTYELISVKGVKGWIRDSWARRAIVALQTAVAAIVVPTASTASPQMDGTAAPGSSTDYSRADHVHPSDTSKQDALSAAQLAALNYPTYYGTCATAAATADKVVTCTGFALAIGAKIAVRFTYASTVAPTTLNVNGTGAKSVMRIGTTALLKNFWQAGAVVEFVYDGTNWVIVCGSTASTTYYGLTKLTSSLTSTSTALALTAGAGKSLQDQIDALSARITALGG